jgi:hypothetical protein
MLFYLTSKHKGGTMSSLISKIPLGTLKGGAQDDVELVIARNVMKLEQQMGQPKNTFDIPRFVAYLNQQHELVSPEEVPTLASNVERAYGYVSEQAPLAISRAGYESYAADEAFKSVRKKVTRLGIAAKDAISKPKPA